MRGATWPPGSLSPIVYPDTVYPAVEWTTMPGFYLANAAHRDLGVVFLNGAPDGVDVVSLPAPNSAGDLVGEPVTSVGYGANSLDRSITSPNKTVVFDGVRTAGTETVESVHNQWLRLEPGPSVGCFGDSGGPQFSGAVAVSITVGTTVTCGGTNVDQRLDLPDVQNWLAGELTGA